MEIKIAELHLPMNRIMYRSIWTVVVSCRTQITPRKRIKPGGEVHKYQNQYDILWNELTIESQISNYENMYQYIVLEVSTAWQIERGKNRYLKYHLKKDIYDVPNNILKK